MQVFRKYLNERLNDPEFKKNYQDNCAICPVTVRIIEAIAAASTAIDEICSQCGIPAQTINDLETAEKCCVASVRKLCDYFSIPRPTDCLQLKHTVKKE